IDNVDLKSYGIKSYDFDNIYPQRVLDIVNDSGTAVKAIKLQTKFVAGNGMTDKDFREKVVNYKGMTVNKLVRKIAVSLSHFNGVPLHVNYNALGQKTEVNFVPFEYARIGLEDTIREDQYAIYDDWDVSKRKKLEKDKIKYVN